MESNSPFASLLLLLPAALAIALLSSVFRSYARLRHIPGPLIPSLSDWWATANIWRGHRYHVFIEELHKAYGPVVRWGPNRVSFAQRQAIPEIYGIKQPFPKAASYEPMVAVSNGKQVPSLLGQRDEKHITEVKRHISGGFSQSAWLQQEDQLDAMLQTLIDKLRSKVGNEISLNKFLSFWSFDSLSSVAFSDNRGYLEHEEDTDGVFSSGKARFKHWGLWMSMPSLEQLIYKNNFVTAGSKGANKFVQMALGRIQERKATDKMATGRDLLGRYLAASQQAPDVIAPNDVLGLTISTIHAGSETTATNASIALLRLVNHPDVLAKLEQEISEANLSYPPPFAELDKLSYLDACIHESMRLSVNPNCTERTVAPTDTQICGVHVPVGTDVSIAEGIIARDPDLYGGDADSFRPERWLDVDKAQWAEMDRSTFAFGYGRRMCIGQHLARIQMKKAIAGIVQNFKITPTEVPDYWVKDNANVIRLNVKLEARN